jgi:hypothetical protein
VIPLRSLPGHCAYRLQRFGSGLSGDDLVNVLQAVVRHARAERGVIRVDLETFFPETRACEQFPRTAQLLGFVPQLPPRRYTRTLRLDLQRSSAAILEALPRTARRNLRLAAKSGARVRVIDDPVWSQPIAALESEAFTRTGGSATPTDWPRLIAFARNYPRLVRIVGLFRDAEGSDLLGFATARAHGDHVEYSSAGTARRPDVKISIGYPLLWDLIEWAHGVGARWFDFGGITAATAEHPNGALGGISDFKRHFGGDEIDVGGEWVLHLHPIRSAVANTISRVAGILRGRR